MQCLQVVAAVALKQDELAAEWTDTDHLLHRRHPPVKLVARTDRSTGEQGIFSAGGAGLITAPRAVGDEARLCAFSLT